MEHILYNRIKKDVIFIFNKMWIGLNLNDNIFK